MHKYPIPTGYLFVNTYEKGQLETLSIGDYGKPFNVKADFLGYTKPIAGTPNTYCMPLSEKWVVTLSTQYGCPQKCTFCDVPNVPFRGNVSFADLQKQLYVAIRLFPYVKYTERLNIHFARMGEPIYNLNVLEFSEWLYDAKHTLEEDTGLRIEVIHPVLTTSFPNKLKEIAERILRWCDIKNNIYNGQAGLQFSINSTNDAQRDKMFGGAALSLVEIAKIAATLPPPKARKYCLNFAFSTEFEIDANRLDNLFNKDKFMVKITPIHNNNACRQNQISTHGGYDSWLPYQKPEEDLKALGWDVLVFVPSMDEEQSLVTCGNAILGGSTLSCNNDIIKILGHQPNSID